MIAAWFNIQQWKRLFTLLPAVVSSTLRMHKNQMRDLVICVYISCYSPGVKQVIMMCFLFTICLKLGSNYKSEEKKKQCEMTIVISLFVVTLWKGISCSFRHYCRCAMRLKFQ